MNSRALFYLFFSVCLLVSTASAEQNSVSDAAGVGMTSSTLSGCVYDDNPPFSSPMPDVKGIDVEVAEMVAKKLGRQLRVISVHVPVRGGFGKALKDSIQSGKCDFITGVPSDGEMAGELRERQLVSTRPYLLVGYILISPPDSKPASLADVKRARRVGVATATPADLFLHKQSLNRIPYANNKDLLAALREREVDMGLVWTPAIAIYQLNHPATTLVTAMEQPQDPSLHTSLAIATRSSDVVLMREIDSAVIQLQAEGQFSLLATRYGLPYFAPN